MKGFGWLKKAGKVIAYPVTKPVDMLAKRIGEKAVDGAVGGIVEILTPQERPMKNWKTTLSGIVGVAAIVAKVVNGGGIDGEDIAIISGLVGLFFAKDKNVTGAGPTARSL
jgi:hypothetical protein